MKLKAGMSTFKMQFDFNLVSDMAMKVGFASVIRKKSCAYFFPGYMQ